MKLDAPVDLAAFIAAMDAPVALDVSATVRERIARAREVVDTLAAGDMPVYGLNTGLGGNLAHRLSPGEVAAFQRQIVAGRAVATGPSLGARIGRGWLLYRLLSAAKGASGISPALFDHLVALWGGGFAPAIPEYGSIGASDLTQNACAAMELLDGNFELQPKDAMVLVNHCGVTVSVAADALSRAQRVFGGAKHAALLSMAGYEANAGVLDPALVALRDAPGQKEAAAWLRQGLGDAGQPRRIQEALSFRTLAPVMGAADEAVQRAVSIWEAEVNGVSDSPIVTQGAMPSTANFSNPALALALEGAALALAMMANASVQRIGRMMDPVLSGLPRYLSPIGGGSAGMVPVQKVAGSLLADIRHCALPVAFDAPAVSDTVEDVAPNTQAAAHKLARMVRPLGLLTGIEGMVAAQAIDLRGEKIASLPAQLHGAIRKRVPMLKEDRPLGGDIEAVAEVLDQPD